MLLRQAFGIIGAQGFAVIGGQGDAFRAGDDFGYRAANRRQHGNIVALAVMPPAGAAGRAFAVGLNADAGMQEELFDAGKLLQMLTVQFGGGALRN